MSLLRKPMPPEFYVHALQDRVHKERLKEAEAFRVAGFKARVLLMESALSTTFIEDPPTPPTEGDD